MLEEFYDETVLTMREVEEIKHALFYAEHCNHGTVGHNMLILIAKLAAHAGISSEYHPAESDEKPAHWSITVPGDITVS